MLSLVQEGSSKYWGFKHPTIRDAFAQVVSQDPELVDIYVSGTPVSTLIGEVSCGEVELEGVKVVIPGSRFELFSERLETFGRSRRENQGKAYRFLAYRCSKEFLEIYIERNESLIDSLQVASYFYAIADIDLIVRLNELGLLPEKKRIEVREEIGTLAIEVPDSGFLAPDVRTLFKADELQALMNRFKKEVVENLEWHIDSWRSNYPSGEDPESYFEPLVSALNDFSQEMASDGSAIQLINDAQSSIQGTIEDLHSELPQEPDYDDYYSGSDVGPYHVDQRSIFDDVDH